MTIPPPKRCTEDFLTIPEIAYLTGYKRGTVERWRLRSKAGEPLMIEKDDSFGDNPVWRLERLIPWLKSRGHVVTDHDVNRWRNAREAGEFERKSRKAGA